MIPFEQVIPGILKIEGGYVANDAGKGPSNFGINATSNPGVDIKNLTKDQATAIYRAKYWDPIVSQLPADASDDLVRNVFDAGVNMGVPTALKLLQQSGPDVSAFQNARADQYRRIVASNPQKFGRFESGWLARAYSNGGTTTGNVPNPATPRNLPPLPGDQATLLTVNAPLSLPPGGSDDWVPTPLDSTTFPGPQPGDAPIKVSPGADIGHVIQPVVPVDQATIDQNVAAGSSAAEGYVNGLLNTKAEGKEKYKGLSWAELAAQDKTEPYDPFKLGSPNLQALSDNAQQEAQASWDKKNQTSSSDRFAAAYDLSISNLAATVNTAFNGEHRPDPGFTVDNWIKQTKTNVNQMLPDNWERLQLAQSQAEANDIAIKDIEDRKNRDTLASGGSLGTMGLTVAAGMGDPIMAPTMLFGGAAVKGLESVGVAARATTLLGTAARGTAEAVIGGTAYTGAKAALGDHVQASDLVMNTVGAAALQLGLGTITGSLSREAQAGIQRTLNEARQEATAAAVERRAEFTARAEQELGPNASPEAYKAKADQYEQDAVLDGMRLAVQNVPAARKILDFSQDLSQNFKARVQEVDQAVDLWSRGQTANAEARAATTADDIVSRVAGEEAGSAVEIAPGRTMSTAEESLRNTIKAADEFTLPSREGLNTSYRGTELKLSDLDAAALTLATKDTSTKTSNAIKSALREAGLDVDQVRAYGQQLRDAARAAYGKKGSPKPPEGITGESLVPREQMVRTLGGKVLAKEIPNLPKRSPKVESPNQGQTGAASPAAGPTGSKAVPELKLTPAQTERLGKVNATVGGENLKFETPYDKVSYILANDVKDVPAREVAELKKALKENGHDVAAMEKRGKDIRADVEKTGNVEVKPVEKPAEPAPATQTGTPAPNVDQFRGMSLDDLRDHLGIRKEFRTVADVREAALMQLLEDRATKYLERHQLFNSKSALATKLNRGYGKLRLGKLNPITSTLIAEDAPTILRYAASILLENPTGALGGSTAALTRHVLLHQFTGEIELGYSNALNAFYRRIGHNPILKGLNVNPSKEFNRLFFEWQHLKVSNPEAAAASQYADIFTNLAAYTDAAFDKMRKAQITSKVTGYENLPDNSIGHMPWRVDPDKFAALTVSERNSYAKAMARAVQNEAEGMTDAEADGLASAWVQLMNNKSTAQSFITTNPYSRRATAEVEEALARMENGEMPEAMREAILSKYRKGLQNQLKSRIQRDVLTEFTDETTGRTIKLMDIMAHDPVQLVKSQAARVAGEVALAQFGVNGKAGLDFIKKVANQTGAKAQHIEAFDQLGAELLGLPVGGKVPNATATLLSSVSNMLYLGGLTFAQMIEMWNMVPAVGLEGMLRTVTGLGRLSKEAKTLANGGTITNTLTKELADYIGPTGAEQYKFLMPISETGRDFNASYSAADVGTLQRLVSAGTQIQSRITFFNALLAGSQRGAQEEILRKVAGFLRDGKNDAALRDMGFTDDLMSRVRNDLDRAFKYDANGRVTDFTPSKARDQDAMMEMTMAIRRGTGQIFQETFAGERGTWIGSDVWRLGLSMRAYSVGSIQKQVVRQTLTHGAAKSVGFLMGSMAWAAPIMYAKAMLKSVGMSDKDRKAYLDKVLNPYNLGYQTLMYSSTGGAVVDAASIPGALAGFEGGNLKLGASSPLVQFFPALSVPDKALKAVGEVRDAVIGKTNAQGERVYNHNFRNAKALVPFGNTPYMWGVMNWLHQDNP